MSKISSDLLSLSGVGEQTVKQLARLDIYSIKDLLLHFPFRYQDRSKLFLIKDLLAGIEATVEGEIIEITMPVKGKTKLLLKIIDHSNKTLYLRFFSLMFYQKNALKKGQKIRAFGEVMLGIKGLEMSHPEYKILGDIPPPLPQNLTPFYSTVQGVSQYLLRKLSAAALTKIKANAFFEECLPDHYLQALSFPSFAESIKSIHFPETHTNLAALMAFSTAEQKRLVWDELMAHRLNLLALKKQLHTYQALYLSAADAKEQQFLRQLPFSLTNSQRKVLAEIKTDLSKNKPMLRLVQGDVGSGKTIVAALAMLQAASNQGQSVLMAPTELLAEQHFQNFLRWFAPLHIEVVFIAGKIKGKKRQEVLAKIKSGQALIVIGTHAVFQEDVSFQQLALVITDEQHRFGVNQRALLREKGFHEHTYPHQLIMTATPIPRTLAMGLYADLTVSTIDELPPGRIPIITSVVSEAKRMSVITRITQALSAGRQVYWVCPLIEESESMPCQSAINTAVKLQHLLPQVKVGLVHGRMKSLQKEIVMQAFKAADIHLLVATSVIEVGVDVPNATIMVIENAERLGLAQLHQLRGRVGRGSEASYCVLLYQGYLSALAKRRLSIMRETTDGFVIAEEDLVLRGPGDILGTRQTGEVNFKVADLLRDAALLPSVATYSTKLSNEYPHLVPKLMQKWLIEKEEYTHV